nr:MAG TPA: hypothetical protein [Caudoviricetes sp.]
MMKLLLLTGESGVGKTTISKKLCEGNQFQEVISASTRQPRNDEDKDHFYIGKEDAWDFFLNRDIVASTIFGGELYFASSSQFLDDKINVYVVDELGVLDTVNYWLPKGADIYVVKLVSDRECDRKHRDYQILTDECFDLIIENDDLDETVEKIKERLL